MLQTISRDGHLQTYDELATRNRELEAQNAILFEQVHQLRDDDQRLRDEIARLKKQKEKPHIGPSKMTGRKKSGKKRKRKPIAP